MTTTVNVFFFFFGPVTLGQDVIIIWSLTFVEPVEQL